MRIASVVCQRAAGDSRGLFLLVVLSLVAAQAWCAEPCQNPLPTQGLALAGWGRNDRGQLGADTTCTGLCAVFPQHTQHSPEFVHVSGGRWHTLGVNTGGEVYAWGASTFYQMLGLGPEITQTSVPLRVTGVPQCVMVATGNIFSLALTADGQVWGWGHAGFAELGLPGGFRPPEPYPLHIAGVDCIVAIDAGDTHSLALRADGTVWAWGHNPYGNLGRGTAGGWDHVPVPVEGLSDIVQIAAGDDFNLALRADGTVWAWGRNLEGELGDGTNISRSTPVQTLGLANVQKIAAGRLHSLAILADGSVRTWGLNEGRLGDGTTQNRFEPVQPVGMDADVIGISGSYEHSLFLKADGSVWACGLNTYGQLGDTSSSRTTPYQLPTVTGAAEVIAGFEFSLVRTASLPPAVVRPPASVTVVLGADAQFSVAVQGAGTISFQWLREGQPLADDERISGSTTQMLSIHGSGFADAGNYSVQVTSPFGTVPCSPAILTVICRKGDLNCDTAVDAADFDILLACTSGPAVSTAPPGCSTEDFAHADMDDDADVDADDFGAFQRCVSPAGTVPPVECSL